MVLSTQPFLIGSGRILLSHRQGIAPMAGFILSPDDETGRSRLVVPALELCEIKAGRSLHGRDEVLAGDGLSIVPLEIEIHAAPEGLWADQGVNHADDFSALAVHRGRVKVVDLRITRRTNGMGHGACILGELPGPQRTHFLDARHSGGMHIHAEVLIPEDRETFLQRELEPVPAGHAVARPIVEILVGHDAIDALKVCIRGRLWAGQNILRVEDVESLVLHGAHVEVADRHDHEVVQVHF